MIPARAVFAMFVAASMCAQSTVVLSGRITDAVTGQGIDGAIVTLTQGTGPDATIHTHYTDAGGNYSFGDAVPGGGQVELSATGYVAFLKTNPDDASIQITADHAQHNFKLTPTASIAGRIIDREDDSPGQYLVARLLRDDYSDGVRRFVGVGTGNSAWAQIGSDGSFEFTRLEPGGYIVSAGPAGPQNGNEITLRSTEVLAKNSLAEGYVVTYYPGTVDFSDALPVTLAGGDRRTIDLRVAKRALFRVSGEIASPAGEAGRAIMAIARNNGGTPEAVFGGFVTIPGPFAVSSLPAGQYTVSANYLNMGAQGRLSFAITDHDVERLKIVPEFSGQLEVVGTFRMANSGSPLPAGLSVQYAFPQPGGRSDSIPAAPTGQFWLNGSPGDSSVRPVVPAGYAATEIRYGGGSYVNSLIPLRGDLLDSALTIVLTDQPGAVAGSLVDGDSKPIAAKIVLAPDPLPPGFDFRALRVASTDTKGGFAFSGIAPGRYKAVALTGDDRKRDHDLAILGDKLRVADSFEVVAGQGVSVNVAMITGNSKPPIRMAR